MSRLACRLLSLLAVVLLMSHAPIAQTRAQNDNAAADAVKNKGLPLITARPLSFTTSEATWMSLDLSPDGKRIVFELLGDLYTLPITGGGATRITSRQGYDRRQYRPRTCGRSGACRSSCAGDPRPAFAKDSQMLWVNVRGTVRAGLTTRPDRTRIASGLRSSSAGPQFAARGRSVSNRAARARHRPPAGPHG